MIYFFVIVRISNSVSFLLFFLCDVFYSVVNSQYSESCTDCRKIAEDVTRVTCNKNGAVSNINVALSIDKSISIQFMY